MPSKATPGGSAPSLSAVVLRLALFMAPGAPMVCAPALADVVAGEGDSVRVNGDGSSLADVLTALGVSYDPGYSPVLAGPVSRSVSGSLAHVIWVLLANYDYAAVVSESGEVDIRWMMPKADSPLTAPPPPPVASLPGQPLPSPADLLAGAPTGPGQVEPLPGRGAGDDQGGPALFRTTPGLELQRRANARLKAP